jgi:hypothetical protein
MGWTRGLRGICRQESQSSSDLIITFERLTAMCTIPIPFSKGQPFHA